MACLARALVVGDCRRLNLPLSLIGQVIEPMYVGAKILSPAQIFSGASDFNISVLFLRIFFNKGKTLILQTSPLKRSLTDPSSP